MKEVVHKIDPDVITSVAKEVESREYTRQNVSAEGSAYNQTISFLPAEPGYYAICWNNEVFVNLIEVLGGETSSYTCSAGNACFLREVGLEEGDKIAFYQHEENGIEKHCNWINPTVFQTGLLF